MKRMRLFGLCLAAMFAFSAMFVASAQAKKGHVNTGNIKFHSKSGIAFLELEGAGKVECESSEAAGEITSATEGHLIATFKKCASEGKECKNKGEATATIVTKPIGTVVGYINKATKTVGTEFFATTPPYDAEL